ncbi:family 43 glycosylhydrolase [Halalkalibacter sp. APA_J-10(15)]|uniref:family 43 glycosylhydrolase n=1 Tax=Halalkalibacter sp. APA_J-10(15) TaxID=2933805 RepID=UPI001FF3C655|nr:family 43 glycosylhydrolase [Halalkalibacter sp. APA_J-10(15)]MCK0471727.1 family 43 glycosylhydrolase [Halalkalibacter sp. APA_J-10(15)]
MTVSGDLGNGTFRNPILRGNYADPSIIRVEEDYYMVHTSYKYVPGLIIWHSTDLINWEAIGTALEHLNGDVWAPELLYYEGLFYIYFPADRTNWVTTAKDPKGPWSKPINLETSYIDPGHVVGPDKKRYLHLSGGKMVQLADDGLSVVGDIQHVYEPWRYPDEWEVEGFSPEGPKFTHYNGYYYCTVAVGGTAGPPTSHMVAASRSKTPWGPWEHSPYNPILKTNSKEEQWWSQGHGTLIDTPNGEWWMVFHAYEHHLHTIGRQTLLLPIEWTKDGWFKVPNSINAEQILQKPTGKAGKHGFPTSDSFDGNELGLHWQWFGEPDKERFTCQNGELMVKGKDKEKSTSSPILYMTGDRQYEAEVSVRVVGEAAAHFILYYDPNALFGLAATQDGVRHFRTFKTYSQEPYTGDTIRLRIRNVDNIVSFYFKGKDGKWQKYDKVIDSSGFHHNTFGGFLSLRIGLDAVGDGVVYFSDFVYRELGV